MRLAQVVAAELSLQADALAALDGVVLDGQVEDPLSPGADPGGAAGNDTAADGIIAGPGEDLHHCLCCRAVVQGQIFQAHEIRPVEAHHKVTQGDAVGLQGHIGGIAALGAEGDGVSRAGAADRAQV